MSAAGFLPIIRLAESAGRWSLALGVTFSTRDATEKADVVAALRTESDLGNKALRPTIDHVVSWTEAEHAQELLAENSHLGKIVLAVGTAM